MALDPNEYFIIVPNMLGNGLSSSPSNTPPPYDKARFPNVTVHDNVAVQPKLVTEHFGIEKAGVWLRRPRVWQAIQAVSGMALVGLGARLALAPSPDP